jgi:hypothetical protein
MPVTMSSLASFLVSSRVRPGLLARRGVQLALVGLVALDVGTAIGTQAAGSATRTAAHTTATTAAPAAPGPGQQAGKPPATKSHGSSPSQQAAAPTSHSAAPVAPHNVATPSKPNDKGWVVQSLTVKKEYVTNDFTGSARITNTNTASKSGGFTITLFRHGRQLGVFEGTALDVAAGKTVTVELISNDRYTPGAFSYDFQADISV